MFLLNNIKVSEDVFVYNVESATRATAQLIKDVK